MGELPEGVRGRVLAVALLITLIAALWAGVAVPLLEWHATRDADLEQQARLVRRMEQVAAELPALRQRASRADAAAPMAVLEGASDAVAGAALQQRLQRIGSDAGAQLASAEMLPGEQLGGYRRIGVRLAVTASWPVIVRLLDAITSGSPRLLVNDLQVQSARAVMGDADPVLSTSMVVFGFRAGQS